MGARVAISPRAGAEPAVLDWLLEGDPAVRWQTLRDLVGAPAASVRRERARVAAEGWGARLLAEQRPDGGWGGDYSPKWTSTHYTLLLLRAMGLEPRDEQARRGCALLLDRGAQPDGGIRFGTGGKPEPSETCVTGMVLAITAYFDIDDARLHGIVQHLVDAQRPDGGWNCRWLQGDQHSSFHTTISVLEGLLEYQRRFPRRAATARRLQTEGREMLLAHRLFRSHRTGRVFDERMTRFAFPPHWHYDVLRALDYFREADASRDLRLDDAIALVESRRRPDGRWHRGTAWPGRTYFTMESGRDAGRWNTLRALRVLRWWDGG
jgi:hypothetical protein